MRLREPVANSRFRRGACGVSCDALMPLVSTACGPGVYESGLSLASILLYALVYVGYTSLLLGDAQVLQLHCPTAICKVIPTL